MAKIAPEYGDVSAPPAHIAIIMDGNGRWAKARGLPRIAGHRKGAEAVRCAVESSVKYGVRYLTLFSFSSENWKRPLAEIDDLMGLLRRYLRSEIAELHKNGVRLRVIGERRHLGKDIVGLIEHCECQTAGNSTLDLILALSYGGRAELTEAMRQIGRKIESGELAAGQIDEDCVASHLDTMGIPDPDLLIRTGGERRISNFLLWQLAYAEFVFLDAHWPDFSEDLFLEAIAEFNRRERRYGATGG